MSGVSDEREGGVAQPCARCDDVPALVARAEVKHVATTVVVEAVAVQGLSPGICLRPHPCTIAAGEAGLPGNSVVDQGLGVVEKGDVGWRVCDVGVSGPTWNGGDGASVIKQSNVMEERDGRGSLQNYPTSFISHWIDIQ